MATVAAGVDFLAQPAGSRWKLSFWNEQHGAMEETRTFGSFGELREHVDVEAPKYARFNRQAKAHASRAMNQPDIGYDLRDELMAEAEDCGELGDVECMQATLERARRELKKDPDLLADVENVIGTYFPELIEDSAMRQPNKTARRNPLGTLERLPKAARMWEAVYKSAQDRGFSEERSAQQAWGAVKKAGYWQDAKGQWHAPKHANPRSEPTLTGEQDLALGQVRGPLNVVHGKDGLWVVGQGIAVPVETKQEANVVRSHLERRSNPSDVTEVKFKSMDDLAHALQLMDVALRPKRHERPVIFRVDWENTAILLSGQPDQPEIDAALRSLDYAHVPFDASVMPYAANPGSPGEAAGYAFVGTLVGSLLGFGVGALVGGIVGGLLSGGMGAAMGGTVLGLVSTYPGGIAGAAVGAAKGAPRGRESDAKWGAGLGAAVPYIGLFVAPAGAYLATMD